MAAAKIGIAVAIIALMLGGFAFVRASAPEVTSTLNGLAGVLTLAHFSSLNMTTSGNTITLGIDLTHANAWTGLQTGTIRASSLATGSVDGTTLTLSSNAAQLNLANANTWTADQTFTNVLLGSSNHILFGSDIQLTRNTLDVGQAGILVQQPSGNHFGVFGIAPSGSSNIAEFAFYRTSTLTGSGAEYLALGADLINSGNFYIIGIHQPPGGSARPIVFGFYDETTLTKALTLTTTPTIQPNVDMLPASDNSINIGSNSLRFSLVRAVTITSGDLNFWPNPCGVSVNGKTVNNPGCNPAPLFTLTEGLTGLIFENHVTHQNQTLAMLNADGSPTPQFQQAVNSAIQASPYTVTVTTTTTVTKIGP